MFQVTFIPFKCGAQGEVHFSRAYQGIVSLVFPCVGSGEKYPKDSGGWGKGWRVLGWVNILPWDCGFRHEWIIEHFCLGPRCCSGAASRSWEEGPADSTLRQSEKWAEAGGSFTDVTTSKKGEVQHRLTSRKSKKGKGPQVPQDRHTYTPFTATCPISCICVFD